MLPETPSSPRSSIFNWARSPLLLVGYTLPYHYGLPYLARRYLTLFALRAGFLLAGNSMFIRVRVYTYLYYVRALYRGFTLLYTYNLA